MDRLSDVSWMDVAAYFTIALYIFIWSVGLIGWNAARRYRVRPTSPLETASAHDVPGVSILRPLKGLDGNLFENLESTCRQRYPKYELIFSVADEDDQALEVVEELRQKYPKMDMKVIIEDEKVGVNPKVNNLMRPYKSAAYDILWGLDSNVLVDPGALARAVDALTAQPDSRHAYKPIGIVHHVPFAVVYQRSLGSRVEEAFLNTNHAKMYLALNELAWGSCITGKSCMYRRSDIERLDARLRPAVTVSSSEKAVAIGSRQGFGMAAFGRFLAEDAMIGMATWQELGQRHDMSCDVARNVLDDMSFMDFVWRRVRWIRVRKSFVLAATIVEPFQESVLLGLLVAWGLRRLVGVPMWVFLIAHFSCWMMVDLSVYASLAGHGVPPEEKWRFFQAWCIREACAFPIWCIAVCGSSVEWRGSKYVMLAGGEVKAVEGRLAPLSAS